MRTDRRIDPDFNPRDEEQLTELTKLIASAAARATIDIKGYTEGERGTQKWIVGIGTTLITAFILGAWIQSEEIASLKQEVTDLKAQVERIEKLVEPRYRGSP